MPCYSITKSLLIGCLLFNLLGCLQAPPEVPVPSFGPSDLLRCTTGGGESTHDELLLRGDGLFVYQPIKGKTVKKQLTIEQTQEVYDRLVQAGLLEITDVPNRDVEHYGVLLEVQLGERQIRGSIGILEMDKKKHNNWSEILHILTTLIEE